MALEEIVESEFLYVNSFQIGAILVFNTLFNVALENSGSKRAKAPDPRHDIVVKINISGGMDGYVIYSLGYGTVKKMTQVLLPGITENDVKIEYKNIVGEIANMMTGNSLNVLSKSGIEISPPSVMLKRELDAAGKVAGRVMVIDQRSPFGEIETTVVLNKRQQRYSLNNFIKSGFSRFIECFR